MNGCIDTKSKAFKELQEKVNLSTPVLEQILYSLQNKYYLEDISLDIINLELQGNSVEFGESSLKLYEEQYKEPIEVGSNEITAALSRAQSIFPREAVTAYMTPKGSYIIRVAEPINSILKNAKRDAEGRLLADNGEISNLTEQQYAQVRTPQFKRWFGDWQHDLETSSVVVDKNLEPKVVYHFSNKNFDVFRNSTSEFGFDSGIFFSDSLEYAKEVTNSRGEPYNVLYPVFLNIRKPATTNIGLHREFTYKIIESNRPVDPDIFFQKFPDATEEDYYNYVEKTNDKAKDGIIGEDIEKGRFEGKSKEYVVINPNQIKSAVSNTGEFNAESDNIYENKDTEGNLPKAIIDWLVSNQFKLKPGQEDLHKSKIRHLIKRFHSREGEAWVLKDLSMEQDSTDISNNTIESRGAIEDFLKSLNLQDAFEFIQTENGLKIRVRPDLIEDHIARSEELTDLFGNTEESKKAISIINFLQGRLGVNVHMTPISVERAAQLTGKSTNSLRTTNAFYTNVNGVNTVYFIEGRKLNADIASEELLHPLVASIQNTDSALFQELLTDAKKLFPKLHLEIQAAYRQDKTDADVDKTIENELVTQALARAFVAERTKNPIAKKASDFIKKFGNFLANLFKVKKQLPFDKQPLTLDALASLINSDIELQYQRVNNFMARNVELVQETQWARTATNSYEVSTQGDSRFSALRAKFKPGTIIDGVDVSGMTIENVYQSVIKKSGKGRAPSRESKLYNPELKTKTEQEDFSYEEGYLPLWQEWARQNPELIQELREKSAGKVLTDKFASTRVSQARALAEILNNEDGTLKDNIYTRTVPESEQKPINQQSQLTEQDMTEQETKTQEKTPNLILERIYLLREQTERMQTNTVLTSTDISEVTDVIADMISSKIDELDNDRAKAKEVLSKLKPNSKKDVESMSRFELIREIGIQKFIDDARTEFQRNIRFNLNNRVKMFEVLKNWSYFVDNAKGALTGMEGIHLKISEVGTTDVRQGEATEELIDEDGTNLQDQMEDGQVSWQIENNTIDPITSLTQIVKLKLRDLYVYKDNGKRSESGEPIYDHVLNQWGTDAKVGYSKAAKCLYRWLSGAQSTAEMAKILKSKTKRNPWVTQLIPMLEDTSGKFTTEQSQFFSAFYKPFMSFSSVGTKGKKLVSRQLNEHPFLTLTMKTIEASYKMGTHPLVIQGLEKGHMALKRHFDNLKSLMNDFEGNRVAIETTIRALSKGLGFEVDVTELMLEREEVDELIKQLTTIERILGRHTKDAQYDPFAYGRTADGRETDGIRSNLMRFFERITDAYEDEAVTSFYEGGKMRQSYLLPSFLTMFTNKFHLEEEAFDRFIAHEFNTEFMRDNIIDESLTGEALKNAIMTGWSNRWIQHMMSDSRKRHNFKCKTSITFNGAVYMKGMTEEQYALAMITEFFGENSKATDPMFLANFRVPIESNKPSAEYITFYARGGAIYKNALISDFVSVFSQELKRMRTVHLRELNRQAKLAELNQRLANKEITEQTYNMLKYSIEQEAITNFDKRGKEFVFLDFLNSHLPSKDFVGTELGQLIDSSIKGKKVDEAKLTALVSEEIKNSIQARVDRMIQKFKDNGVFEKCKTIEKIGQSDEAVTSKLNLMLWNDAFASTQIMQLLITDPAFLKNTDDVQKRFAQVHASGNRANLVATDLNGVQVSDGVHRSITLKDVEGLVSNIVDNLTIALDRRIANSKSDAERISWKAFKEKLVGEDGLYRKSINLTDAQAYSCPTSYRKKALMFGLWSKEAEATYQRIRSGKYSYSDVATVFQPFKPFVYGNSVEETGVNADGTMSKMRVPVQNKNAECLLVMADAILAGENTGKPNLLRALFEVMEESHYTTIRNEEGRIIKEEYKTDGIDTVNFESAVKSGAQGRIDTRAYTEGKTVIITKGDGTTVEVNVDAERAFKDQIKSLIYNTREVNGERITDYNRTHVKFLSYENYCMQQSVPEHFLDHAQLEGSQQRALIPSDLATVDADGNTIYYEVGESKTRMTASEIRERLDELHAENIQKGINEVVELFQLENSTPRERNEALSELLVEQFMADGRYSSDMLYLVTVDRETGNFPISLEDPSIRTQVEQALNSIIKSRVNKLKMKGGPLVQMSNFGMSKELKIRFLDKEGNPLKDRSAFDSDEAYKDYVEKNQGGISHFEVIAPAYTESIFRQFMDSAGNISVEALEALNPDLLKMIGYRIPTEAKYSIAPLKIVGFAPKEMGDVIILPAEITLITGSDFDVDKEYCVRKLLEVITKIKGPNKYSTAAKELTTALKNAGMAGEETKIRKLADDFVRNPYDKQIWLNRGLSEAQYLQILKEYVNIMFEVTPPTEHSTDANNNEIFDLSYSVLTSESNVARALKPGGFEEHKQIAYAVAAWRIPTIRDMFQSFDTLLNMNIKDLENLMKRADKNLIFMDTQLEYYGHNNSASSLLGISAVNSVAHAILVDDNIGIQLAPSTEEGEQLAPVATIAGFSFSDTMRLDPSTDTNGASVGETLGSCVAASADAAKDPVLNFMNLNPQTFNVYTTLIRLGMPNNIATLLMSSSILAKAVVESNAKTLKGGWSTPEKVLRDFINDEKLLKSLGYSETSPIWTEEITREELINGIALDNVNINLKIANALVNLFEISRKVRLADQITRFNSISSAVGPTTLDNYAFQRKLDTLNETSSLIDMATNKAINGDDLLAKHKSLAKFSEAYDLAQEILINGMPQTKAFINSIEHIVSSLPIFGIEATLGVPNHVLNDRSLMGKLREFYTSYIAVMKGMVHPNELRTLSEQLPKTIIAKKLEHKDNYLVQNLYLSIDAKSNIPIVTMNISKIEKSSKDYLSAAWADLYNKDKAFALDLFKYSFFRGGLGFSPKTFMSVLPVIMKRELPAYVELFTNPISLDTEGATLMYKQFISNNYLNDKIVPVMRGVKATSTGQIVVNKDADNASLFTNVKFFKVENGDTYKLYECTGGSVDSHIYRIYSEIPTLGAQGNFMEISPENIEKSMFKEQFEEDQDGSKQLPTDPNDVPVARQKTIAEARRILDTVLTQTQQQETKEMMAQKEGQAKTDFITQISQRLNQKVAEKGLPPVSSEVLNEIINIFNPC